MSFDRFNDKPRREDRFSDRGPRFNDRGDRFGDRDARGSRFGDRNDRFGSRQDRFGDRQDRFGDRPERGGRFGDRDSRFGDRRERDFGPRRFGDKPEFKKFPRRDGERFEFGTLSGTRAKSFDKRRFSDRNAFVQTATVRLDADVAKFFKTAEEVNAALRQVIALAALVKQPAEEKEQEADVAEQEVLEQGDEGLEMSQGEAEEDAVETVAPAEELPQS